ncbi:MAG TPA: hypothetical protein VFS40_03450 [Gemmatimonadales bacterium]|nr:hypothetical protein [Gemmatimonadales bacterium]
MKYLHRTQLSPDEVIAQAATFFGQRLSPTEETPRRRAFAGAIGTLAVTAVPEGGHYTLVTIETNQVGESEIDKLGKRFLTLVHTAADPTHRPIGAY